MARVLYIGQAIDRASASDLAAANAVTAELARRAAGVGWLVYRPLTAWTVGSAEPGPEIEAVNRAALAAAGAFVAVSNGARSVGLWRELEAAVSAGVPAAIVGEPPGWSSVDAARCHGLEEAIGWLLALGAPTASEDPARAPIRFIPAADGPIGTLPTRAYDGDAGFDLYTADRTVIPPGEFRDVPCGVRVALPEGVWGRITGRSSTLRRRGLLVAEGVIDTGYRGPLFAGCWNLGAEDAVVERGDRVAQMLLHFNAAAGHQPVWVSADEFARIPHDGRASGGFGSTGT